MVNNRPQGGAYFGVYHQIGILVLRCFVPVQDRQPRPIAFGQKREPGGRMNARDEPSTGG
jgi:hypothetical protein